jgi:hypothetical protein
MANSGDKMRLLLPALLVLTACGRSAEPLMLATRADSAGIEIVTNSASAWQPGEGWRLEATPALQIGHRPDNDSLYDLLRVSAGAVLRNGEVIALVGASRQVRVFSPSGEWLRSIGRDGAGPGELRRVGVMVLSGDTLFIPDGQLRRLNAFRLSGEFLRSWQYLAAEGIGNLPPSHRLEDGSWITSAGLAFDADDISPKGVLRQRVRYYRVSADLSGLLDTIVETPGRELAVTRLANTDDVRAMVESAVPAPLGRFSAVTVTADRFAWGENSAPEVQFHVADGSLRRILRWTAPPIAVDAALLERVRRAALARAKGDDAARRSIESQYAHPSPAPVVPYFGDFHFDATGALWVQDYLLSPDDSVRFRIFRADGQYLGQRALPPRNRVLDIGHDRILTVWQDADDLEYLRVYRVDRASP